MGLENNLHTNLVKDVEMLHTNLYVDRHKECNMSGIYEQCLDEISKRTNVSSEYVHNYYMQRYEYDWKTNTSLGNRSLPKFLQDQAQ